MHPNENDLHDYVDGAGEPSERSAIERHLASCASCRQLVEDLKEITHAVSALEPRDPPVRVWSRIERAITLERHGAADASERLQPGGIGGAAKSRRAVRWAPWLAAAAALLLATVVGLRVAPGRTAVTPAPSNVAGATDASHAAQAIQSELQLAETHYVNAIKGLEQITSQDQDALDPKTAASLRKTLAVVDQAISESRAAVRAEPASEPAQHSLIENFKTKVALLQDTVALINELRKGDDAGAARIVSGLKQKGN
jgi:anti-sigma factor ChrR (cupin superfamily)